ncbi:hypothetical protein, conserved, partial [Eimeria tenella]
MEELRNVGERPQASPSPPSQEGQDNAEDPALLRSISSTSTCCLLGCMSTREALRVSLHSWEYLDDFGKTQGPFDALRVLKWIQNGYFDKRGNMLFRKRGDSELKPLLHCMPYILTEAYALMVLRMQRPEPAAAAAAAEEPLEMFEAQPMQLAEKLNDADAILDAKMLQRSLGTCDLLLVLVPPRGKSSKRNKSEQQTILLPEDLLKKAR